ncbi:hypothetical protein BDZ94DRAFT_1266068 [Collybia nuda]|uniref:Nephrocystin 3-like N-terminal domain-containing protein n=1 Tax=Collybia nuda TaxID=64659 RepID=A0A9P6CGW9_9AGAR|nr:hypothetical protein BDZ94DRAFT_1266068 [Collybia nuda]
MGAGKSAIAQTISETAKARELLAAAFFFSRGHPRRGNIKFLVSTIAYQLSLSIPDLRDILDTILVNDPSILHKSVTEQLKKLIVEPFKTLTDASSSILNSNMSLVVIDGLDECANDKDQRTILDLIMNLVAEHKLPLMFFITSRRAHHIEQFFGHDKLAAVSNQVLLEPSEDEVYAFLESGLSEIRAKHEIDILGPWPTPTQVEKLVQRSSGYFIYATTVLRFLDDPDRHPDEQLTHILRGEPAPFTELDMLYHQILCTVADTDLLVKTLHMLVAYRLSPWGVGYYLGHKCQTIKLTLRRMTPLLDFSGDHDPIDFIHASFIDFLFNRHRARTFYINRSLAKKRFDHSLFRVEMMHKLMEAFYIQMPLLHLLYLWWWLTEGLSKFNVFAAVALPIFLSQPPFAHTIMFLLTAEPVILPDALLWYSTYLPEAFSLMRFICVDVIPESVEVFDFLVSLLLIFIYCLLPMLIFGYSI